MTPCAHGNGFRHEALFYAGDDGFLEGTLAFVHEGVRADEPVLVIVDAHKIELLRAELDGEADLVTFLDMGAVGHNPARIIPLWREFVDANVKPGAGAWGIGEPISPARSPAELGECQRHESLLNVAFEDGGAWSLLCPYDSAALPDDVLDEARRSHPLLRESGGKSASDLYDSAAARRPFGGALPEPEGGVSELRYGAGDIAEVRAFVKRHAGEAGFDRMLTEDLVVAVNELATNSIVHAAGFGTVRIWTEGQTLLCELRDSGTIEDPLVGRVVPPADALSGRGIWIVNQLCDLIQVRSSQAGTTVRLHMSAAH